MGNKVSANSFGVFLSELNRGERSAHRVGSLVWADNAAAVRMVGALSKISKSLVQLFDELELPLPEALPALEQLRSSGMVAIAGQRPNEIVELTEDGRRVARLMDRAAA